MAGFYYSLANSSRVQARLQAHETLSKTTLTLSTRVVVSIDAAVGG